MALVFNIHIFDVPILISNIFKPSVHPQGSLKKITLTDADISETHVDKKQFAFRIKSKDNGRSYYIHADNQSTQTSWMQALFFAKAAGNNGSESQACVLQ